MEKRTPRCEVSALRRSSVKGDAEMNKVKILVLVMVATIAINLSACSTNSVLKEATGSTNTQAKTIESMLADIDIVSKSLEPSINPLTHNMDDGWKAYDLISEDGNTYLLILRKEDNDFTAVLDSEGKLLSGLISNAVLPAYFPRQK